MGNLEYFVNDWIVNREDVHHVVELFEKADAIGCVGYLLEIKQNDRGYLIQPIVIQTTEHHMIDEFAEYAGSVGFVDWKPCLPPPSGNLPTHIAKIAGNIMGVWIDGLWLL